MRTAIILVLCSLAGACSVAVRSPQMYRDDTQKVLQSKAPQIHACYDDVLKGTPGVGGKVAVKFDVETEAGKFVNVRVDPAQSSAPAPVQKCVTDALQGLALAPPDSKTGDATFLYDFQPPLGH
jgi:hypothetical protein